MPFIQRVSSLRLRSERTGNDLLTGTGRRLLARPWRQRTRSRALPGLTRDRRRQVPDVALHWRWWVLSHGGGQADNLYARRGHDTLMGGRGASTGFGGQRPTTRDGRGGTIFCSAVRARSSGGRQAVTDRIFAAPGSTPPTAATATIQLLRRANCRPDLRGRRGNDIRLWRRLHDNITGDGGNDTLYGDRKQRPDSSRRDGTPAYGRTQRDWLFLRRGATTRSTAGRGSTGGGGDGGRTSIGQAARAVQPLSARAARTRSTAVEFDRLFGGAGATCRGRTGPGRVFGRTRQPTRCRAATTPNRLGAGRATTLL